MKIGIFTDTYTPQINGVTTVVQVMDRVLTRLGHEVYIFAPSYERRRGATEGRVLRFPALTFAYHKESRFAIPYSRATATFIKGMDVLHSHTPFSMGVLALRLARKHDLPHIHTYHTLFTQYLHYLPRYLRPTEKMTRRISAAFCNRCNAVTVPSEPMRQELLTYGITVPLYTLPFGMDIEDFEREPVYDLRAELGLPASDRLLLCAGRLGREKNIDFVLRAFARMLASMKDLRLILAGDGPERASLEQRARELSIAERVHFTGYLEWRKLIDYDKQADLFVYGSKTEVQPMVFLEALAAGTPVIAVGAMGALDVVKQGVTGLLLQEDEEAYSQAVVELLSDHNRLAQMRQAARERARAGSAQCAIEKLLEIYRTPAKGLRPASSLQR